MPRKDFDNIGKVGIISDIDVYELPDDAWSAGLNVRFDDNYAKKFTGHSQVFGSASIVPYWMLPVQGASNYYWVYAGLNKVYVTDGTTHTNVTRQTAGADVDYAATADINWNGGIISGIPVLNNGIDDPQMWDPASPSTKLVSLTWDATNTWEDVGWSAKCVRPFQNYLVAMDITQSGTRYQHKIAWSHPSASGAVPASWDATDATVEADERDLSQTSGDVIDSLPMRNVNMIYKEDSVWQMSYIGGSQIFRIDQAHGEFGALSRRCIKQFGSNQHIVLAANDVVIHDGSGAKSILHKKWQSWLFNNIDNSNFSRSFVTPNYKDKELWICFPQTGSALPDKALVWNYQDNTFGIRDLPSAPHIAYGIIDPGGSIVVNDISDTIDSVSDLIDQRTYNPTVQRQLIASTNLYLANNTNQLDGANMTSYLERTGLVFKDPNRTKVITRLWPRMTATGPVMFRVGSQMEKNGPITWKSGTFDPSADTKLDIFSDAGYFMGLRIESSTDISWQLHSLGVEFEYGGRF